MTDTNMVNSFTDRRRAQLAGLDTGTAAPTGLASVPEWLATENVTGSALSPDGGRLAFVSDRDGLPALWVRELAEGAEPVRLDTGPEHVRAVSWSPDGRWLACLLAPFGGEQTQVLALRPDGTGRRVLAGGEGRAATLGGWRADGRAIGLTESSRAVDRPEYCHAFVVEPSSGRRTPLVSGPAAVVCALSSDGRRAVVRVGRRGTRQLLLVDTRTGRSRALLAGADATGADASGADATVADARFGPDGRTLYLHTDSGRERPALFEVILPSTGLRATVPTEPLVARPDADLELFALGGRRIAAVWNEDGYSAVELWDRADGSRRTLLTPVQVVTSCAFAPDHSWLLLGAEGPTEPPHVRRCPLDGTPSHRLVPENAAELTAGLVSPTPLRFAAQDGLELSGWWYTPVNAVGPAPTVLWLHGGPEAQERPTFAPLLQALADAGVAVFAPNVRGSSGFGRAFVNADNGERRFEAIADVAAAADFLVSAGLADPSRLGVSGRSYGGYLTLAALVSYPELFRVGVDVCGMADLETFFAFTEPWIADAATSKYGDPQRDRALLRELSPLHRIDRLVAPLLVVHGEHDTNVPLVEAEQVVNALRERGAAPGFLLFPDEGHEVHGVANRVMFVREVVRWLTGHLLELDEQTA